MCLQFLHPQQYNGGEWNLFRIYCSAWKYSLHKVVDQWGRPSGLFNILDKQQIYQNDFV